MKTTRRLKAIMLAALCAGIGIVIAACYGVMDDDTYADDDDSAAADDDDSSQ